MGGKKSEVQQHDADREKRERQIEAQRENDARRREADEARRRMFSAFSLWKICNDKRCKRAHACRGDVGICMNERWHVVIPAELKAKLQKIMALLAQGIDMREAIHLASADMARRKPADAANMPAAIPAAPPAPQVAVRRSQPRAFGGPRVRAL
jgi:hypothetical protein